MIRVQFALHAESVDELVHEGFQFIDQIIVVRLNQLGKTIPSVERRLNNLKFIDQRRRRGRDRERDGLLRNRCVPMDRGEDAMN